MLSNKDFCVLITSCRVLAAFIAFMRFLPDISDHWPVVCTGSGCTVQGWLSATSGWAAVLVGGWSIFYLGRQIAEQRKQTDFVIGDVLPTVDSIQHLEDHEEIVLRLVNWNRRGVIISDVGLKPEYAAFAVMKLKVNGETVDEPKFPFFLDGWEDRLNRGPETAQFYISAHRANENKLIRDWPKNQQAYVDVLILGEEHKSTRLTCFVHPQGD